MHAQIKSQWEGKRKYQVVCIEVVVLVGVAGDAAIWTLLLNRFQKNWHLLLTAVCLCVCGQALFPSLIVQIYIYRMYVYVYLTYIAYPHL